MTTGVLLSDHDAVIRDLFGSEKMYELTGDEGPIVSSIRKDEGWTGGGWELPIQYATNQTVSATFATMQALAVFNKFKKFDIDPYEYFGRVQFSRMFMKMAHGPGAEKYVDGVQNEWEGLLKTLVMERAFQFYGDGSGMRGRLTSAVHATRPTDVTQLYVYLEDPADSAKFYIGMECQLDSVATGGTVHANSVTLTGIDPDTGKLTSDVAWNTCTGAAAEDYVFRSGDYDKNLLGLAAWIPPVAPGAAAFEGVDRTAHIAALSGNRVSIGTMSISEALRTLAAKCRVYGTRSRKDKDSGGMSVKVTMNTFRWTELETELEGAGIRDFMRSVGDFGYEAIRMRTTAGDIDVFADPMCPYNYAWLLDIPTWTCKSAGKMPEIFDEDGTKILREYNANQFEGRAGWIAAYGCAAPGNNGVLLF